MYFYVHVARYKYKVRCFALDQKSLMSLINKHLVYISHNSRGRPKRTRIGGTSWPLWENN